MTYHVQWSGSYRSGRLSDMPDRPSIMKGLPCPILDARRHRCHLRCIIARAAASCSCGLQHMFAMFGATVLVPVLTGLSVSATLLFAGIGTLLFHFLSRGRVPAFLGSSFPLSRVMPPLHPTARPSFALRLPGVACAGLLYPVLAALFRALAPNVSCASFRRW